MQAAPQDVVRIDSRLSARERAERHWTAQTPENRQHHRQARRKARAVDAQLVGLAVGGLVTALTYPSWIGPLLIVAGFVVPALTGAWLDTYRPIGGRRHPGSHDLAIAVRLDQGEAQ